MRSLYHSCEHKQLVLFLFALPFIYQNHSRDIDMEEKLQLAFPQAKRPDLVASSWNYLVHENASACLFAR